MLEGIKDFFKLDGAFFSFMEKIMWAFIVSVIFLVSCLPVVSIGAAIKASFTVMNKAADERKVDFVGTYLNALFTNFGTSFLYTLTLIGIGALSIFDMLYFYLIGSVVSYIFLAISIVIFLTFVCIMVGVFQMLSREDLKYKDAFRATVKFLMTYKASAIGTVVTFIIFNGINVLIILFQDRLFMFRYLIIMGPGLYALVVSYIYNAKLVKNDEEEE